MPIPPILILVVYPSVAQRLDRQWCVLKLDQSGTISSDALESAKHAVSEFLYRDILSVWACMMACDTE